MHKNEIQILSAERKQRIRANVSRIQPRRSDSHFIANFPRKSDVKFCFSARLLDARGRGVDRNVKIRQERERERERHPPERAMKNNHLNRGARTKGQI